MDERRRRCVVLGVALPDAKRRADPRRATRGVWALGVRLARLADAGRVRRRGVL